MLYKQLSGVVELPVGTIVRSFNVNVSFKSYYRDMESCQGIWVLNRGWVLYFMIYMFIHQYRKETTFHGKIIFVIIELLISLHNVQNKVYFKYFKRYFVFNHDILLLNT